jgi:GxxExxY protein
MELLYTDLTKEIMDCAYKVHTFLGPGLLESSYEECLYYELLTRKFIVEKQKAMPLVYKSVKLETGYRLDLIVENKVILEIKSVEALAPIHTAQLLTYLKLSGCRVGFIMNFNVQSMKEGIKRFVL